MDPTTLTEIRAISMLSEHVLVKLAEYAGRAARGILEIGPYIGGSTVALSKGNRGVPHVAIEMGGSYLEHPTLPSKDILSDLDTNLQRFGVRDRVVVVPGSCYEPSVRDLARGQAPTVDLLFIDADGRLPIIMAGIGEQLSTDCALIFDDFTTEGAADKQDLVRAAVSEWVARGAIAASEEVEGTWFGRVTNLAALRSRPFDHEVGHAYLAYGVTGTRVLENGVDLGPAGCLHSDIREKGSGRFSFHSAVDPYLRMARPCVYFSASDNSDPRTNGRNYEFR